MSESKMDKGILIFIGVLIGLSVAIGFSVVSRNKQKSIQQPVQKLAQESFEAPITTTTISESTIKKPLDVIDYYYSLLSSKKLKEAYAMHISPSVNYAQFEEWYKDDISISPHTWNAIEISKNTYKFSVDLWKEFDKERGFNIAERYEVVMKVEGNKIQTLSSKQISGSKARFGQIYAYAKKNPNLDGPPHFLMLEQNGVVKKIDEGYFGYIYFSPNGNYLIYTAINESAPSPTYIYDISKQKKILDDLWSLQWSEFTPDEKYFMACAYTEMDPVAYGSIYQLPDFKLKYDLFTDPKIIDSSFTDTFSCRYDNDKNSVKFIRNYHMDGQAVKKEVEYFLNTGKITYF